jgi:hypothetical protein
VLPDELGAMTVSSVSCCITDFLPRTSVTPERNLHRDVSLVWNVLNVEFIAQAQRRIGLSGSTHIFLLSAHQLLLEIYSQNNHRNYRVNVTVMVCTCIREVMGSHLSRDTCNSDSSFRCFPQSSQENFGRLLRLGHDHILLRKCYII